MAYGRFPVGHHKGYGIWHHHAAANLEWSGHGTDGTLWFEADSIEELYGEIDDAVASAG